jgi:hypothetical protein
VDERGSSSDYASASPSKEEKDDHVAAVYTLNAKGQGCGQKAGRTPLTFHGLTPDGNQCFHDAISAAKAASTTRSFRGHLGFLSPLGRNRRSRAREMC